MLFKPKFLILSGLAAKMGTRRSGPSSSLIPVVVPINNYNYRHDFNQTIGETCENNLDFDGVVFGKFICPIEGWHNLLEKTYQQVNMVNPLFFKVSIF